MQEFFLYCSIYSILCRYFYLVKGLDYFFYHCAKRLRKPRHFYFSICRIFTAYQPRDRLAASHPTVSWDWLICPHDPPQGKKNIWINGFCFTFRFRDETFLPWRNYCVICLKPFAIMQL